MPKTGQTWCFQPPFPVRNWRYEKWGHFFALLRADLLFWALSRALFCFQKGRKMPKKGQFWCFQPPFTLTKCTMKPDDKYERNRRYENMRSFFALLRADLAVCGPVSGPVFSIFSPDMMQTSLFDPANAKSSPSPPFSHRFQLRRPIFNRKFV